MKLQYTGSVKY